MTVTEILAAICIKELLHFTTNRGLVGTLAAGTLLSRYRLPEEKYLEHILHVNAANRPEANSFFDKSANWLDYVNLSIGELNHRYFEVSQRWHLGRDVWWVILSFDPVIASHDGVFFATTNNSYDRCIRATGAGGLELLFGSVIHRKSPNWSVLRGRRDVSLPTCEQAEVLYPGFIPAALLRRVYVREEEHHDLVSGWLAEFGLPAVQVVLSANKFSGNPN